MKHRIQNFDFIIAKPAEDSCKMSVLNLKPGFKIMMMGSLEDDITQANTIPEGIPDVVNDLDIDDAEIAIENMEVGELSI